MPTTTSKITLTNRSLHALFKPVLPATADDPWVGSTLTNVLLSYVNGSTHLVAAATDRYRVFCKRVQIQNALDKPDEGEEPTWPDDDLDSFCVLLPRSQVRAILDLFKPSRGFRNQPRLTLEVADGNLTVTALQAHPGAAGPTEPHILTEIQVAAHSENPASFPPVWELLSGRLAYVPGSEVKPEATADPKYAGEDIRTFGLNPRFIADLTAAVRWEFEGAKNAPVLISLTEPRKPIVVRVGLDFVAMVMPVMLKDEGLADKVTLAGWQALISAVGKQHKAIGAVQTKAVGK